MKKQKKPDEANLPNLLFFSKIALSSMRLDILKLIKLKTQLKSKPGFYGIFKVCRQKCHIPDIRKFIHLFY